MFDITKPGNMDATSIARASIAYRWTPITKENKRYASKFGFKPVALIAIQNDPVEAMRPQRNVEGN